jgi:hypothetical protein
MSAPKLERPRHDNTANGTPEYQIRRKRRGQRRKADNHVLVGIARGRR